MRRASLSALSLSLSLGIPAPSLSCPSVGLVSASINTQLPVWMLILILIIAANLDEQQQLLPASIHNSRQAAAQLSVMLRIVDPCVCVALLLGGRSVQCCPATAVVGGCMRPHGGHSSAQVVDRGRFSLMHDTFPHPQGPHETK